MRTQKILVYNKNWEMTDDPFLTPIFGEFWITNEHKYLDEAVAVIFDMPTMLEQDRILTEGRKKDGQLWVFWSMECETHPQYLWQQKKQISDLFDIKATYKIGSDIPVPYLLPEFFELIRREPVEKKA